MKSYATASTQIDVDYLPDPPAGVERDGALTHRLAAQRAVQAEQEGYDAFCPFGTQDYGVRDGRKLVKRMPVVGQADACLLYCGVLGRRFGAITYMPPSEQRFRNWAKDAGVSGLLALSTSIGFPNNEYPQRRDELLERFVARAHEARALGAELMGVVAMSICPVEYSARELSDACGMPVLDAQACQIAMAEWWHRTGLPPSLLHYPR